MYPCAYDLPLTGLDWLEYYPEHNVYHPGVDLNKGYGDDDLGADVVAARSGFVVFVQESVWDSSGFGKFIIIQHADNTFARYAHLADIKVKEGQEVKEGKLIGHVGKTGTTYAHLHFEIMNKKCMELQIAHWRPWRFYPSGWTKAKVQEYYLNPFKWLEGGEEEKIPAWAVASVTWAKNEGILHTVNGREMKDYEVAVVAHRLYEKLNIS